MIPRSRPLGRHAAPRRKTGLNPGKALQRGSALARTTAIRARSAKNTARYRIRVPLVIALLDGRTWCEIRWDEGCEGRSVDVHEPGMRCRGADICDEAQCITACRHCHNQVHAHPAEATRRGWMIPSGRPTKAVPR